MTKFLETHFGHFWVQYFGILPPPLDVKNLSFFKASLSLQGLTLTTVSLVNYRVFKIRGISGLRGFLIRGISGLSVFGGITLYSHFSKLQNTNYTNFGKFIPFICDIYVVFFENPIFVIFSFSTFSLQSI